MTVPADATAERIEVRRAIPAELGAIFEVREAPFRLAPVEVVVARAPRIGHPSSRHAVATAWCPAACGDRVGPVSRVVTPSQPVRWR